jgi:nucleoside phosphorylase
MTALIVVPTSREAVTGGNILVCGSGVGVRDMVAARVAVDRPSVVVLAGFCGGLDPSIAAGGLILVRRVLADGQEEIEPDLALFEAARRALRDRGRAFVSSRVLTVDAPLSTRVAKTDLWNVHGAGGVDMETYWVAEAARSQGVPWIALRAVLDTAHESLPQAVRDWRRESDEGAVMRSAARRPQDWAAYARLALHMRKARRSLKLALPVVLHALATGSAVESLPLAERGGGG